MDSGRLLFCGAAAASSLNNILLQTQRASSSSKARDCLLSSGSSSSFLGSRAMLSFEDVNGESQSQTSFFHPFDHEGNIDEDLGEYIHQPDKKRRLTTDQVQFLEKSFKAENKLEPERKVHLAKELGLQSRQVAIWFQNRRARCKTKQLEKDYEALLASYNQLKADCDSLCKDNEKLKDEVLHLSNKLLLGEKKGTSELPETQILLEGPPREPSPDSVSYSEMSKLSTLACKQEDISSARNNAIDSDSSHYTDGSYNSSILEPGESSYIFEPNQSDISQDENDSLGESLLRAYGFPNVGHVEYAADSPSDPCYFGLSMEDNAFDFWSIE